MFELGATARDGKALVPVPGGRFTAYAKSSFDENWYLTDVCNDTKFVPEMNNATRMRSREATCLMYQRREL